MHEYSIVRSLLDRVAEEATARDAVAVHRIEIRVGEASGVEIDLLCSAFEIFRAGTVCGEADLQIAAVPATWLCPSCRRRFAPGEALRCVGCAVPAALAGGDEIVLDRIEMEVA